ncbi:MAG: hypothetical protein GY874_14510 [Desulfobacteraceae bacterium]|nr:hypothetical protein [Desulfobacteraceae bacterium]
MEENYPLASELRIAKHSIEPDGLNSKQDLSHFDQMQELYQAVHTTINSDISEIIVNILEEEVLPNIINNMKNLEKAVFQMPLKSDLQRIHLNYETTAELLAAFNFIHHRLISQEANGFGQITDQLPQRQEGL